MEIINIQQHHFPRIAEIYQQGLDTGIASFETQVPDWQKWDEKFLKPIRLIALEHNQIMGWLALSPVSQREAYKGVAEVSLYIDKEFSRKGVGTKLLTEAIDLSQHAGFWTLQAVIFEVNEASVLLHKKCGFRVVGYREKIAQRLGVWHNTILMEIRLDGQ